jgi:hypothetical protein
MTRRLAAKLLILSDRLRVCDAVILYDPRSGKYSYLHPWRPWEDVDKFCTVMSMEEVITQLCIDFPKGTTLEIDTNI